MKMEKYYIWSNTNIECFNSALNCTRKNSGLSSGKASLKTPNFKLIIKKFFKKNLQILVFMKKKIQEKVGKFTKVTQTEKKWKEQQRRNENH